MSELRFTFRGEDEEAPIRDDQARFGAPFSAEASGPVALDPLYLERPGVGSRRRSRGVPLAVASVITFLLAAVGAAAVLGPPKALRDLVGSAADLVVRESGGRASPPAPPASEPVVAAASVESAAAEAALAAAAVEPEPALSEVAPRPAPEAKAAPEKPVEPPPKKPRRKPAGSAKPAPRALDLDALERSLS